MKNYFSFTDTLKNRVGIITCEGELDAFSLTPISQKVHQLLDEGCFRLIFDLSGVDYMDSSGIRLLLEAYKGLQPRGGSVELVGCNRAVLRLFQITRLVNYFRFWDSLEETHYRSEDLDGIPLDNKPFFRGAL